ncbi:MAG: metal ABC transporter substrate-binding protein [Bulleidia sp.]
MKKSIHFFSALLLAAALTACAADPAENSADTGNTIDVVTNSYSAYDWVKQIFADDTSRIHITYLLENGVDLHNYQPDAEDIRKIAECDVFIYVGGESDSWAADAIRNSGNSHLLAVNMLDSIGKLAKEEEVKEGMQAEAEEEEEPETDEHVWLSVRNASVISGVIFNQVSSLVTDPEEVKQITADYENYQSELMKLDQEYSEAAAEADLDTLIFGDRFPFRYLLDDYGIDYYAAFAGCSAETEASFETVRFLAEKADEIGARNILTIETSDQKLAETIINNTQTGDQGILVMNSIQSVNAEEVEAGLSYLDVMRENLEVLKQALSSR